MELTIEQLQLVRLLVETSSLAGEELEQSWELLREIEIFLWNDK